MTRTYTLALLALTFFKYPHCDALSELIGPIKIETLLHTAAAKGDYEECMRVLPKFQVDDFINLEDGDGNTPLHVAAAYGHYRICVLLLRNGARRNTMNNSGQTPFDVRLTNVRYTQLYARVISRVEFALLLKQTPA